MLNEIKSQPAESSCETAQCADSQTEKGYLPLSTLYKSDRSLLRNRLYSLQQFLPKIFGLLRRIQTFLSFPTISFPVYEEESFIHLFKKDDIWRASYAYGPLRACGFGLTRKEALEAMEEALKDA